jgi:hypothetical protein
LRRSLPTKTDQQEHTKDESQFPMSHGQMHTGI